MLNEAIAEMAGGAIRFGDRLCDVIGTDRTLTLLQTVLQITSDGCLAGATTALTADRVRAASAQSFGPEAARRLAIAGDHAGLLFEIACRVRDGWQEEQADARRHADRARHLAADTAPLIARLEQGRADSGPTLLAAVLAADLAALPLCRAAARTDPPQNSDRAAADRLVSLAQNWIKALGQTGQIGRDRNNLAIDDFLIAIDGVASDARLIAALSPGARTDDLRIAGAAYAAAGSLLRAHRLQALAHG